MYFGVSMNHSFGVQNYVCKSVGETSNICYKHLLLPNMVVSIKMKSNREVPEECNLVKEMLEHITTVVHVLALGLTIFVVYLCFQDDYFTLRTWHVLFYTVGWFLLTAEGVLYLTKENILAKHTKPRSRVHIHWIVISLGVALTIAGFVTIFIYKSNHFSSTHGKVGLASGVLGCLACLNGIPALFSATLRKKIPPNWNKLFHAFIGFSAVVLGAAAMITAYKKTWFISKTSEGTWVICLIITVIITSWALLRPIINMFSRVKSIMS